MMMNPRLAQRTIDLAAPTAAAFWAWTARHDD